MASQIPEITPKRFDVEDREGLRAHLIEHGYACVKEAARPHELERAREMFWDWLQQTHYTKDGHASHGFTRSDPTTWADESFGEGHTLSGGGDGVMGAASHCPAFWYVRTLPGICGGFAAAYGTDELVTAFDRMSVQRPSTCGSEAVGRIKRGSESFDQRHLHTHFNQDGFGEDILVCYGIMSLWDMNRRTGATQIVPGSHKPEAVEHIQTYRKKNNVDWDAMSDLEQRHYVEQYTSIGLQPAILNVEAGDLVFFDTALYHGVCHAEDPVANGPNELLRAIFIQSMVPAEHLGKGWGSDEPPLGASHRADVLRARRIAFETGRVTGGSIVNPRSARQIIQEYQQNPENYADPTVDYSWENASEEARRLVCPEVPEGGFLPRVHEPVSQYAKL